MKLDSDIIITLERRTSANQPRPWPDLVAEAAGQLLHFCPEVGYCPRKYGSKYIYASLVHCEQDRDTLELGYRIDSAVQERQ